MCWARDPEDSADQFFLRERRFDKDCVPVDDHVLGISSLFITCYSTKTAREIYVAVTWIFEWAFDIYIDIAIDTTWLIPREFYLRGKYSRWIHVNILWINVHSRKFRRGFNKCFRGVNKLMIVSTWNALMVSLFNVNKVDVNKVK